MDKNPQPISQDEQSSEFPANPGQDQNASQEDKPAKKNKKLIILVIVVAALLILPPVILALFMTNVALPNLQESQRNTQRRLDLATLQTNITHYMTNNEGNFPSADFMENRILETSDPSGEQYHVQLIDCDILSTNCGVPAELKIGEIYVVTHASCKEGLVIPAKSSRAFAIWGYLEERTPHCLSSN